MRHSVLLLSLCLLTFSSGAQTLADALAAKDTVLAARLIRQGADPNAKNEQGASLLMESCHFADLAKASFLLRHGAKADEPRSPKGRTALMVACAYWCGVDMVKLLVEHHANLNAASNDGMTPLMLAAQNEKLDVVDFLLSHGAKAGAKNASGQTALDLARAGKVEDYMINSVKDTRFDRDAVIRRLEVAMK